MLQERADAVGVFVGKTATYGGGASAVLFGLSANELAALIGAAVAVLGFCVQVHYSRRREGRDVEFHAERMRSLREDRNL